MGRDSVVSTSTRYGLASPGIESRWGARFSVFVKTGPGAHPASYTMGTVSFPVVKRPGCGVKHPPPSSAEVKDSRAATSTTPMCLHGELYLFNVGEFNYHLKLTSCEEVYFECVPIFDCIISKIPHHCSKETCKIFKNFFLWRAPQQTLRTYRSLEAYCATLCWRWLIFFCFSV